MNNKQLRKLALMTLKNGKIDSDVAKYALSRLSKSELKQYLFYFKNIVAKNTIEIISDTPLLSTTKKQLEKVFHGKTLTFEEDKKLGGGLFVRIDDTILDLSVKNYIEESVIQLKNNL